MKKLYFILVVTTFYLKSDAQVTEDAISSSFNVFTVVGTRTQLWTDPSINTMMFIHRSNMNNGNDLYYDINKSGGGWSIDQGPLYSSMSLRPRYPQAVLANPSGVPDPDSTFVVFSAPVTDTANWRGIVSGEMQVVSGSVATADVDSLNAFHHMISTGYVLTPQGVIWSVDAQYIGTTYNDLLDVSKGIWNNTTRKFDITTQVLNAPVVHPGGDAKFEGCSIAFSPDGQTGYVVMVANNGTIGDSVYYPIVFYTGDGGVTWSSGSNISLNVDAVFGNGSPFYTMGPQFDLAVDSNNSLHIASEILEGDNHWDAIAVYGHFGIFDISSFGGNQWKAQLIAMPENYLGDYGIAGDPVNSEVWEYNRPQITMNMACNKLFFTWTETDTTVFGSGSGNIFPDLHIKGYDIVSQLLTSDINITEFSGLMADGNCTFFNASYYCTTGVGNNSIPIVYSSMQSPPISTGSPVQHYCINGITINNSQFTIAGNTITLPGGVVGAHHRIGGNIYCDANANGIKDGAETSICCQLVSIQPDSLMLLTDNNGDYSFYSYIQNTTHTITTTPPAGWSISSDSSMYHVADDTIDQTGFDFGITASSAVNGMQLFIAGGQPRCGWPEIPYSINYINNGTTILNGRIEFVMDNDVTFHHSVPVPDQVSGDTLFFDFSNLNPFNSAQAVVYLTMPAQAGDTLQFYSSAAFDSSGNYYTLDDNNLLQVVTCSYDPNDKTVEPEGLSADHYTLFNDTMLYTIRFQNTGNDTAFTVVLRDTLDPSLDMSTLRITGSSHPVRVTVYQNHVAEFTFENILLPDSNVDATGSMGFVQYSIQPLSNLTLPVVVNNTAYIYFDYNQPVQTNTVSNTLVQDLNVGVAQINFDPGKNTVVPNPFHSEASIVFGKSFSRVETKIRIMDAWGQIVYENSVNDLSVKISGEKLRPGIYFYELRNNNENRATGKFIIE